MYTETLVRIFVGACLATVAIGALVTLYDMLQQQPRKPSYVTMGTPR